MRRGLPFILRRLGWLAPVLVLAAVWIPVWSHYRIPNLSLPADLVEGARSVPADTVLAELEGMRMSGRRWSDQPGLVSIADRLLAGALLIPGYPETRVTIPFDPADTEQGLPGWQLELASLVVPEILLEAYEQTGRQRYLDTARDVILAWASHERSAVIPKGFLYNDHAIASRTVVLGHFWRLYRRHPSYDPDVARRVLEFALRGAHPLADPDHFTVATNHGVMQNLALWHLAVAFPWMPERDAYRETAFQRLEGQMMFYVNTEGAVLEHSGEYQAFGVELVGMALRYLTLMGEEAPAAWIDKYHSSVDVYARMRRPDGSLPAFGDTDSRPEPHVPLVTSLDAHGRATPLVAREWTSIPGNAIYPQAGWSIWWDGSAGADAADASQTLTTWSYFPGHGHKHADETSVLLWARGTTWWTNVGYWKYGVPGRDEALSWPGSNAPHLVGEPASSDRRTRALGRAESARISVLELEREGPGAFRARRLVLHRRPDLWLVLDRTQGAEEDRASTVWTASPDVNVHEAPGIDAYRLVPPAAAFELRAGFQGSAETTIHPFRGSQQPFAGWAVRRGVSEVTTSIVVDRPARDSWSATAWSLAPRSDTPSDPLREGAVDVDFHGLEAWTVTLSPWLGGGTLRRDGARISASGARGEPVETVTLSAVPVDSAEMRLVRESFRSMATRYPRYRDYVEQRVTISTALIAIALISEIFLFVLFRLRVRFETPLRAGALAAWVVLGIWLTRVYFIS